MSKCPFCNEEIEHNTKTCPYCCEKIPAHIEFKVSKKKLILTSFLIILLIALTIFGYIKYNAYISYVSDPTYKSIVVHEDIYYAYYQDETINVINKVLKQNDDLLELMQSNEPIAKKEAVFDTYIENLDYYGSVIAQKITTGHFQGIKFSKDVKIVNPKLPMYYSVYDFDSGDFVLRIDYKYVNENYAKYLGQDWQAYLTIKQNSWKLSDSESSYTEKTLNQVVEEEKFVKKYPKFKHINEVKPLETTKTFVHCCYQDSKSCTKKLFEEYFKEADKQTESYTYISKTHEILKKYKWKNEIEELYNLYQKLQELVKY